MADQSPGDCHLERWRGRQRGTQTDRGQARGIQRGQRRREFREPPSLPGGADSSTCTLSLSGLYTMGGTWETRAHKATESFLEHSDSRLYLLH